MPLITSVVISMASYRTQAAHTATLVSLAHACGILTHPMLLVAAGLPPATAPAPGTPGGVIPLPIPPTAGPGQAPAPGELFEGQISKH